MGSNWLLLRGVARRPSQVFRPGPGRTHRSGVTGLVARRPGLEGGRFAARLPGTQSTFLAPARRCCRRLGRRSSYRTRGAACGGGRDLGSSDAALLRLAALGRGGGGPQQAARPPGPGGGWGRFRRWPCPRPEAGRCQERRVRCGAEAGLAGASEGADSPCARRGEAGGWGSRPTARPGERTKEFG